jgi:predicted SnoaL-like aldol condensation-catalyzing enzyme
MSHQTKKQRQGPKESATLFEEGATKKGNDGNMWKIIATDTGVRRWSRVKPGTNNKTVKKSKKKPEVIAAATVTTISQEELVKLAKHHKVTTSGSKKELAEKIWRVRGNALPAKDLSKILHLLSKESQKKVNNTIKEQIEQPITNYRGMWYPQPKPLREMRKDELLRRVRQFRDAFEKITTRNQDLHDDRLAGETDKQLRNHLQYYFSEGARLQSEDWLRDYKP